MTVFPSSSTARRRAAIVVLLAALLAGAAPAPPFAVRLRSGETVRSDTLAGRLVVLNFWATWCAPCRAELAEMDAEQARVGDRLAIYAILAERDPPRRLVDAQAKTMALPIALEVVDGAARYRPINNGVPTTFVIAPDGTLLLAKAGAFRPGEFRRLIQSVIGDGR